MGLTYQQIGIAANVSRQRVQQLIRPPTSIQKIVASKYENKCAHCQLWLSYGQGHVHHLTMSDIGHYNDIANLILLCIVCHRRIHAVNRVEYKAPQKGPGQCIECGQPWEARYAKALRCPKCRRKLRQRRYRVRKKAQLKVGVV